MTAFWVGLAWLAASLVAGSFLGRGLRAADRRQQAASAASTRRTTEITAAAPRGHRPPGTGTAVVVAVALVVAAGLTVGEAPVLDWAYGLAGAV